MVGAQQRLRAFRARNQQYLRLGHDRIAAARFVVDVAGALHGPALDVGTGKGLLAIELARQGLEVVSIDIDDQERELATLLVDEAGVTSRIAFDLGDAAHLPYADGHFGSVAMMDVLHHLDEPVPVLREMTRLVGVGGVILIADFDEHGFELASRVHRSEGREHPRTAATISLALEELSRAGICCKTRTTGHQHEVVVLQKQETKEDAQESMTEALSDGVHKPPHVQCGDCQPRFVNRTIPTTFTNGHHHKWTDPAENVSSDDRAS
jgi:2-polyprenyl-3-methyl-5-hydroxy-6-metoxy-1,4-benzoquinol methylase